MRRALATLAIAAAGLAVGACGKDEGKPIPQTNADDLVKRIEQVRRQSDAGSCIALLNKTLPGLEKSAQELPSSVGSDVRTTITDGIDHLRDLATNECNNKQNQTTTDQSTSDTSSSDTTPSTSESTQSSDTSTSDSTQNTDTGNSTQSTQSTDTSPPSTDTNTDTGGGGVTPPTTPSTPTTP